LPQPNHLGAHEMMEVHELLNFKTICTAKAKAMDGLVTDKELKALMQQDLQQSMQAMDDLQALLARAHAQ
jgi:similar to spore coat protein